MHDLCTTHAPEYGARFALEPSTHLCTNARTLKSAFVACVPAEVAHPTLLTTETQPQRVAQPAPGLQVVGSTNRPQQTPSTAARRVRLIANEDAGAQLAQHEFRPVAAREARNDSHRGAIGAAAGIQEGAA